jgi:hypothetical protein
MKNTEHSIAEFIGKTVEHAEKYVRPVRVVAEDGKRYMVTRDYRPGRLNVELVDSKISRAYWG